MARLSVYRATSGVTLLHHKFCFSSSYKKKRQGEGLFKRLFELKILLFTMYLKQLKMYNNKYICILVVLLN